MRAEARLSRHVRIARACAVACALAACAPVRPQVGPRLAFPFWTVADVHPRQVGCAQVLVWISKTGKEGLGASLAVTAPAGACPVRLVHAEVDVAVRPAATAEVPPAITLAKGQVVTNYLPFFFDNEAAWNAHRRRGRLVVDVAAGAARAAVEVPLFQRVYPFFATALAPDTSGLQVTPIYPSDRAGGAK